MCILKTLRVEPPPHAHTHTLLNACTTSIFSFHTHIFIPHDNASPSAESPDTQTDKQMDRQTDTHTHTHTHTRTHARTHTHTQIPVYHPQMLPGWSLTSRLQYSRMSTSRIKASANRACSRKWLWTHLAMSTNNVIPCGLFVVSQSKCVLYHHPHFVINTQKYGSTNRNPRYSGHNTRK